MKTLVLGLGNELLADEGIGIHAVRRLHETLGERGDVACLDGGTLSFTLAAPIAEADRLIVIDAAELQAVPGTVRLFRNDAMDDFLAGGTQRSVHDVGLIDLMAISRLTDTLPAERVLVGIQPQKIDWGESPTPAVAAALPMVCEIALGLIKEWDCARAG